MKKRTIALLAAAGATITVVAAVTGTIGGSFASGRSDTVIHEVSADYPAFDAVGDIAGRSTVVVRATAVSVGAAYREIPAGLPVEKLPAFKAAQIGTVLSDVTFRVDRALKGEAPSRLTVAQLGGQVGADRYVDHDEPLSVTGRSYVLFLQDLGNGKYGIVGGPQGRFLVDRGSLKGLGADARDRGVGKQLHGANLDGFERDFARLAAQRGGAPAGGGDEEPLQPKTLPGPKN